MNKRTALIGLAGLAVGGLAVAGVAVVLDDDPTSSVDSVTLSDVTRSEQAAAPTSTDDGDSESTDRSISTIPTAAVEGLEELAGQLRAGGDADEWYVANVDVEFGPNGWLQTTTAPADFDGDGTVGTVLDELRGLEGSDVILGVRFDIDDDGDNDRDDADVFTINALAFRDPTSAVAPWQIAPDAAPATREAVIDAALEAVGANSTFLEISAENDDGFSGWEVEVRRADGNRYEVLVTSDGIAVDVRPYED
jgi:hypothetical protein